MRRLLPAALVLALAASAEERFPVALESGDTWDVRTEASLHLRLTVTPVEDGRDGTPTTRDVRSVVSMERTVDWVQVARNGEPEVWKVAFGRARTSEDEGTPEVAAAWEGKSWEVRGIESEPADPPAEVLPLLHDLEDWKALLPPEPVEVGATWTIPPARVARLVVRGAAEEPNPEHPFTARLAEIRDADGTRVAVIALSGTLRSDTRQDFRISWAAKGEFHFDLTARRPVKFELSGEAEALEGRLEDGRKLLSGKVDAKGSVFRVSISWTAK